MKSPNKPGAWWAKGVGYNADLGWKIFVVEAVVGTNRLVVRLADALHTRHPWFTSSPKRWTRWTKAEPPGSQGFA